MKKSIEEHQAYAKVIAQAWVDEEFKKRLLADSATVLKESGIEVPEGMTVRFVEEEPKENEIIVPLPPRPHETADLSDDDLHEVAGGIWGLHLRRLFHEDPVAVARTPLALLVVAGTAKAMKRHREGKN